MKLVGAAALLAVAAVTMFATANGQEPPVPGCGGEPLLVCDGLALVASCDECLHNGIPACAGLALIGNTGHCTGCVDENGVFATSTSSNMSIPITQDNERRQHLFGNIFSRGDVRVPC